ncbi:MAG: type II toxin-antitoxin system HicB family antitoxin [Ignavibacteriae bacterium]|nr:type II toxin-antitoxin system HicB family antitoxin [Ignavibacteriota bacterium]
MEKQFTAVIVKSGEWYAGTVKELSGVHSQGKTIQEVRENLKEAVQLIIESNIKHFRSDSAEIYEEQIAVNV